MCLHAALAVNPEILRERERKTADALRDIDRHLLRLQVAKTQRVAALARIRAEIALSWPSATVSDED